ncbi:MAG: hypothetical protein WKG07_44405 [Hymenobacter sp.]
MRVPYKGIALSRHNIFKRDQYECQYCGSTKTLTLDHVLLACAAATRAGPTCITACARCNHAKGRRTPAEANMPHAQPAQKADPRGLSQALGRHPRPELARLSGVAF